MRFNPTPPKKGGWGMGWSPRRKTEVSLQSTGRAPCAGENQRRQLSVQKRLVTHRSVGRWALAETGGFSEPRAENLTSSETRARVLALPPTLGVTPVRGPLPLRTSVSPPVNRQPLDQVVAVAPAPHSVVHLSTCPFNPCLLVDFGGIWIPVLMFPSCIRFD